MTNYKNTGQSGFTLLETLITLIIFSVGITGIAGMQVKTQKFNRSALFETEAVIIGHDILERVRANTVGQNDGYYHLPEAINHADCSLMTGCSALEMAQTDMYEWAGDHPGSIFSKLPGGSGLICLDSTPDDGSPDSPECDNAGIIYTVKIWWTDADNTTRRAITTAAFK